MRPGAGPGRAHFRRVCDGAAPGRLTHTGGAATSQRARFAAAGVHESKDSGRLRPHITVTVSTRPGNDRMMASTVLVAAPLSTSPPTAGCRSYIAAAPCCALRCSRRCAALPAIEPAQRDGTELHSLLYLNPPKVVLVNFGLQLQPRFLAAKCFFWFFVEERIRGKFASS